MTKIGFLSFGHWTPASLTRSKKADSQQGMIQITAGP